MSTDVPDPQLARRLREGLDRICVVMRSDQWSIAGAAGLNPTQAHALTFIAGRGKKGVRVGAIASTLGVTQPTATDSIAALVRKGFLVKASDASDARVVSLRITPSGREVVRAIGLAVTSTERALETLTKAEQVNLLELVVKTIRALQIAGVLAPQRMCVTCKFFRPNVHSDAGSPHHCDYVDAAFGAEALRVDCPEHEGQSDAEQENVWRRYIERKADVDAAPGAIA